VELADLAGRLLVEHHEPGDIALGAEKVLDRVDALFDWMLDEHPAARDVDATILMPSWPNSCFSPAIWAELQSSPV